MGCNCSKRATIIKQAVTSVARGNVANASQRAALVMASLAKDAAAKLAAVKGR